eukprot:gene38812-47052_t
MGARWCDLGEFVADPSWPDEDREAARGMFRALWEEHCSDGRSANIPALFNAQAPDLARRFEANLNRVNAGRGDRRDSRIERWFCRSVTVERRSWATEAVRRIEADYNRSADTHLIRIDLPRFPGIVLYLKDESSHPTGSLKHRLARSLFLYALCNAWIGPGTCVIESSSGSTAVSEAYFARMLGLRFIAVVPASTAAPKLDAIRFHGGEIHMVEDPRTIYDV